MRIVVPYTDIHPDTRAALEHWPSVEYRYTGHDDYAYGRLLRELWSDGEDFLLIEHDVVPTNDHLIRMVTCPNAYCAAPYAWLQAVGVTLGFTRFRSILLRTYPDTAEIACRIPHPCGEPGHYRTPLDVWLQAAVLRDLYGLQPCCHLPAVGHRNWENTPADAPLRTQVEGRCYLADGLVEQIAEQVEADRRIGDANRDAVGHNTHLRPLQP